MPRCFCTAIRSAHSILSFYLSMTFNLTLGLLVLWGKNQRAERSTLLSLILMSAQWLHTKSSTWSSKWLFMIIMIHLTSLNPDWTPPRLKTTSKFLALSFSGKIEARINLGAGSLFTSETHFKHRALITCQQLRMLIPNNFGLKSSAGNQNLFYCVLCTGQTQKPCLYSWTILLPLVWTHLF